MFQIIRTRLCSTKSPTSSPSPDVLLLILHRSAVHAPLLPVIHSVLQRLPLLGTDMSLHASWVCASSCSSDRHSHPSKSRPPTRRSSRPYMAPLQRRPRQQDHPISQRQCLCRRGPRLACTSSFARIELQRFAHPELLAAQQLPLDSEPARCRGRSSTAQTIPKLHLTDSPPRMCRSYPVSPSVVYATLVSRASGRYPTRQQHANLVHRGQGKP
jgi:hypothetical protein